MIFDTKEVNTGRQPELDIARAIACLIMIVCHVGIYCGIGGSELLNLFSEIIGSEFGAPVFMTLMGIGICYSRNSEPKAMALRGIKLLGAGYLLGFIRQGIPILIFGQINSFYSWPRVFEVDILQFAGLAMLAISFLRKLKIPSVPILMLSVIFLGIGECLTNIGTGNLPVDLALNLIWGSTAESSFPFLHWFFYVAFGMVFGELLKHCNNKDSLYRTLLPISGLGVLFVYILLVIYQVEYYNASNFYWMGVKNAVYALFYVLFMISVSWYISKHLNDIVMKICQNASRCTNSIYCISWVIISALLLLQIKIDFYFNDILIIILMILVTIASYYIALWYSKMKSRKK